MSDRTCRVMFPLRRTEEGSLPWISRERATRAASSPYIYTSKTKNSIESEPYYIHNICPHSMKRLSHSLKRLL